MRLPFAPLAMAIGRVYYAQRVNNGQKLQENPEWRISQGYPTATIAELTGVGRRRLTRWQSAGIPEEEADAIAVKLGLHPSSIWPEWFAPEVVQSECRSDA